MDCKQEQLHSKSKSSKRRERRREAAALQKLAASVISEKIESSVELPKKLSEDFINILNKSAATAGRTKSKPDEKNITTEPYPNSVSDCEKPKSESVLQSKSNKKSKAPSISLTGSNERKDSSVDFPCVKQCSDDKGKRATADCSKNLNNLHTHEACTSVKPSCSPRSLKKRNAQTASQVSEVESKALRSVQENHCNCNVGLVGSITKNVDGGSHLEKPEKNKDPAQDEVKAEEKDLENSTKKRKRKRGKKGTENSVSQDLLIGRHLGKDIDSSLCKDKTKPGNVHNEVETLETTVSKVINQSTSVFPEADIISKTPEICSEISSKEQSLNSENSKIQGDTSLVSNMNKTSEKVSDQKQGYTKKTVDVKCVPLVTDGMEEKVNVENESKKDAADREKVKAEREARKAAKLMKKQKEKVTKENVDLGSSTESKIDELQSKSIESVQKNDVLPTAAKENESNASTKSKAELRAERRAKQEAQRAAKAAATTAAPKKVSVAEADGSSSTCQSKKPASKVTSVKVVKKGPGQKLINRFGLGDSRSQRWKENSLLDTHSIHPAIVQLGTRFTDRIISGSNARCIAFVQAMKKAIQDYETPAQKELARDLEACLLTPSLEFLEAQRPHAVSVTNATHFLKWHLTQLQPLHDSSSEKKVAIPDEKAKQTLVASLDSYVREKIELAEKAVCLTLRDKIQNGDVILTYGCSYLLQQIFLKAKEDGTLFKVVVVDGRPWKEGREMLRSLLSVGIPCSYVLLSAASSVMRQVNKVILGAHALLSNGYVMSRVGVSQVALLASAHNVPVLVACETYKFCERVQSDSFVYNEMGEPDGLSQLLGGEEGPLSGWKNLPHLSLLNLSYDVTPPELVTAVATELAVLPCTSVPVVLRVQPMERLS